MKPSGGAYNCRRHGGFYVRWNGRPMILRTTSARACALARSAPELRNSKRQTTRTTRRQLRLRPRCRHIPRQRLVSPMLDIAMWAACLIAIRPLPPPKRAGARPHPPGKISVPENQLQRPTQGASGAGFQRRQEVPPHSAPVGAMFARLLTWLAPWSDFSAASVSPASLLWWPPPRMRTRMSG